MRVETNTVNVLYHIESDSIFLATLVHKTDMVFSYFECEDACGTFRLLDIPCDDFVIIGKL